MKAGQQIASAQRTEVGLGRERVPHPWPGSEHGQAAARVCVRVCARVCVCHCGCTHLCVPVKEDACLSLLCVSLRVRVRVCLNLPAIR